MLAYVFWHSPRDGADVEQYEQALIGFHRSLARELPVGTRGSATFAVRDLPWLAAAGYEDWYLLEDYAALGVLGEAAVGRGHRTPHDRAARNYGFGAGAVYALIEGRQQADVLGCASIAVWVQRALGAEHRGLEELLGDGIDPGHASLWRRQLVLGPAPELCVLADEEPQGVAGTRLPDGWSSLSVRRKLLWHG